jgi:hypothetical protein
MKPIAKLAILMNVYRLMKNLNFSRYLIPINKIIAIVIIRRNVLDKVILYVMAVITIITKIFFKVKDDSLTQTYNNINMPISTAKLLGLSNPKPYPITYCPLFAT